MLKLHECTTISMTEAEYVVVSDTIKEALWLDRLVYMSRQADPNSDLVVFSGSQGALALAKNLVHNAAKHIEVRYHFV